MTLLPPAAARHPHETVLHGETRIDDYYWMREKSNPEVRAYLESENAFTEEYAARWTSLRDSLFAEIRGRIKESDISVPYKLGDWLYYSRTEQGKQYPTFYRRPPTEPTAERVVLDLNELSANEKFLSVGSMVVSPNGELLAYSTDTKGFREYTLHIKRLHDHEHSSERIERVNAFAWARDNKTLFYVVEDDAKRPCRMYRHVLGTSTEEDVLVFEEKDERFRLNTWLTLSHDYVVMHAGSHTTSEVRLLPADRPSGEFLLVQHRRDNHKYDVTQRGDQIFIRTNDKGRNFRLVTASVTDPGTFTERIAHREDVMLERVTVFADFIAVTERRDGLRQLRFLHTDGSDHVLTQDESVYELNVDTNAEFRTSTFRYNYQSMVSPMSVVEYDVEARTRTRLKQIEVLGGYDPGDYQTTRIHATAGDGTKVPISLVHRKDTALDGTAPMYLQGYGAYGSSYPASFSHARVSLLDRGLVCAIAHVRGGGELGKRWHDDGRMLNKRNSFTDFIACAEHVVAAGYTSKDRLIAQGGSAGGLLMGGVVNLRPDLFRLVILDVPFVDVISTMLDDTLPLTVGEFEEWGNPKVQAQYDYIRTYCPYTNLSKGDYPALLVKTSFEDSQVMYWEPAKYVAKLRRLKADENPLIFKINMAGGHGGSSGRYDSWKEVAFDYAFLLSLIGKSK